MFNIVLLLAAGALSAAPGPDTTGYMAITVGDGFACAINTRNDAYCWGQDRSGVLGAPGYTICGAVLCSPVPQAIPGGIKFRLISAGNEHVCGISIYNKLYCWGSNGRGQLGIGWPSTSSYYPQLINAWHYFDTLSAGAMHTCARSIDTTATFCWGDNQYLQLGNTIALTCSSSPTLPCSPSPVPITTGLSFRTVQAGLFTSCGLEMSGKVYCWGSNMQLGFGNGDTYTGSMRATPKPISGGLAFAALTDGAAHACALEASGAAWCWGNNSWSGALGNGGGADSPVPVAVLTSVPFVSIAASHGNAVYAHGCALASAGAAYCWGSNSGGQLGVASAPSSCSVGPCATTPIAVSGGLSFFAIAAGREETCAIRYTGHAYCWGRNNTGQLGDGSAIDSSTPVLVLQF